MISVSGKHWEEVKIQKRLIDKVKIDNELNETQAKIALSRNYTAEDYFLIKNNIKLNNPFLKTRDFLLGCELLNNNVANNKSILIIGDYDVDGCMSTILLVDFLKKISSTVNYYIPDRFKDGYGASKDLILKLVNIYKPELIILLDCGSNSYEAVKYLKLYKIKVLIIDHHNTIIPYPLAEIFINPKKKCEYQQYDNLCTTFLTFLFIKSYIKKYSLKISIENNSIYVLLATIADVMPIKGINKILAKNVLNNFDINKKIIFKKIFKKLEINNKLSFYDIGYKIAPLINAAGRLENANQIVELFTTHLEDRVVNILQNLYNLNNRRKLIESRILDELDYENLHNKKGILFICKPNLHQGLIGIIASRIKDYFDKPCVILTETNNILKGSARSTSDFNIGEFIQNCVKHNILLGGGGHNLAAGLTLEKNKLILFKKYLNHQYMLKISSSKNKYLSILSFQSINEKFIKPILQLGPFGNSNPYPIFLIKNVKFTNQKTIKNKFIMCFVKKNAKLIKAITFCHPKSKLSYLILNSRNNFDIIAKVKINNWNKKSNIELEIIDLIENTN